MFYFFVIYLGLLLSYLLFHPSLAISEIFGAIDYPSERKIHSKPMARGGGFAIFVAFSVMLIIIPIKIDLKIPLILSGVVIFLIGFLDDAISISPFMKLSGQFLALAVYHFISELLGYEISIAQGVLGAAWIIFITNATNIIDGLDGLACGVCAGEALCLAIISLILGKMEIMMCALLLLGVMLGFFPHNFPRAKIFMGDCGALFLGFLLAALSSRLVIESESILCLLSIFLVFRIPMYDTNLSIIRRLAKRKNPFKADKEHFHHLLLRHGFSKECAALLLISVSLLFGLLGIVLLSI